MSGRQWWLWAGLVAAAVGIVLGGCRESGGNSNELRGPGVVLVAPDRGNIAGGESVTIVCSSFKDDFTMDVPIVRFGSIQALSVTPLSRYIVSAVTPPMSTGGRVDVKVIATARSQRAVFFDGYTYTAIPTSPPVITALLPDQGAIGSPVTIQGLFFGWTPPENLVRFDGNPAPILSASGTDLLVVVPPGVGTGPVNVEVYGSLSNDVTFTVTSPHIDFLLPSGGFVGDPIAIVGENFSPSLPDNEVRFNGTLAIVTAATPTQLDTTVPNGAVTGSVTVKVGGEVSGGVSFCVFSTAPPPPVLASLSPASGPVGATVTIDGTDFASTPSDNLVTFDGVLGTVLSAGPSTLMVEVPPRATTGPVSVSSGGRETSSSLTFTVTTPPPPAPTIFAIVADEAEVGDAVWIDGMGFDADPRNNRVEFNGVPAAVAAGDASWLLASVPPTTSGPVTVAVGGQVSLALPFVVISPTPGTGTVDLIGQTLPMPSGRVIYVIDRSGSMSLTFGTYVDRFGQTVMGTRTQFVADRVIQSFQGLSDTARFNVYTFACNRNSWAPETQPATAANKTDAEGWLVALQARGGTGTGPGMAAALQEKENRTVMLLTDGQPNCGAAGTAGHLCLTLSGNTQEAAIHTFGLGASGIFRDFLVEMAMLTGGTYTDVVP